MTVHPPLVQVVCHVVSHFVVLCHVVWCCVISYHTLSFFAIFSSNKGGVEWDALLTMLHHCSGHPRYLSSLFLAGSSLSEDVSQFDFSTGAHVMPALHTRQVRHKTSSSSSVSYKVCVHVYCMHAHASVCMCLSVCLFACVTTCACLCCPTNVIAHTHKQ